MPKQAKMQDDNEEHRGQLGHILRNLILGGQDGIVNVLGIVLGVAVSTRSEGIVIIAGLAAMFAESLSMAAVAYTSSKAESEHYHAELKREIYEMEHMPEREREEIADIYRQKGLSGKLLNDVVDTICADRRVWLETMMREELGLEDPKSGMSPTIQGIVVGVSAFLGSFIPLIPFFIFPIGLAVSASLGLSLFTLFVIGAYKSKVTMGKWFRGGLEMMIIGGLAAGAGYLVGLFFQVPVS